MADKESAELILRERARCASIVERYVGRFTGLEGSVIVRILNQIRNGMKPESFSDQMADSAETQYTEPSSINDERNRCVECVRVNSFGCSNGLCEVLMEITLDVVNE